MCLILNFKMRIISLHHLHLDLLMQLHRPLTQIIYTKFCILVNPQFGRQRHFIINEDFPVLPEMTNIFLFLATNLY